MFLNLRFNYEQEWNSEILNNLCQFYKGNGLSKNDLSDSGYSCILYGQLYTTYLNEVITSTVSKTNAKLDNPFYAKRNDLIIPSSGEDPIDIAVARSLQVDNVLLGGDLNVLRPKSILNSSFLSYQLNGKRKVDIAKIAQGKSIVHLHNCDLKRIKINYPCIEEQNKIANLLFQLDKLIETQIKIIKDLESVKNEISNRIFKLKLIEKSTKYLAEYLREGDKTPVNTFKYKKITIKLNKQGIVYSDINRDMADTRPFYIRHKDELIIGKQNYFNGSIAIVDEQYDNCICSNAIMSFNVVGINKEFLYFQLSNNNYLNSQSYKANGTGQKELSEKELLNFKIWCPSIEEQIKIVNCFKALDGKIKNEKAVLNSYMQEKDYLLTNMFI